MIKLSDKLDLDDPATLAKLTAVARNIEALMPSGQHLTYGSAVGRAPPFDFKDANILLVPFGVNDKELGWLEIIASAMTAECKAVADVPLHNTAARILQEETAFNLAEYDLHVSAGGARDAILQTVRPLMDTRPAIAYASPNWIFDMLSMELFQRPGISFHAASADEFVEGFEGLSDMDKIAALIVVDPANPLGYRFTEDHIARIEDIAAKHGVVVIFDDVFRGLQPRGERHSASGYSKNSIVVETTSKRFTARGSGVTWTLVPKSLGVELPNLQIPCRGCYNIASVITQALYETEHDTKVAEFVASNSAAFRRGFEKSISQPYGEFRQAFPGMPIMTYHMDLGQINSSQLAQYLAPVLAVSSGFDWICAGRAGHLADDELKLGLSYIRICPTKEDVVRSYIAGYVLGETICGEKSGRKQIMGPTGLSTGSKPGA